MPNGTSQQRFDLEALEARVLLSGDALAAPCIVSTADASVAVVVIDHSTAESGTQACYDPATQIEDIFAGADAAPVAQSAAAPDSAETSSNGNSSGENVAISQTSSSASGVDPQAENTAENSTAVGTSDAANRAAELSVTTLRAANGPPSDPKQATNFDQIVYLDLDGASGIVYNGPVTITGIGVPDFKAPASLPGQEASIVQALLDALSHTYKDFGLT